jgi:hypothetical protein
MKPFLMIYMKKDSFSQIMIILMMTVSKGFLNGRLTKEEKNRIRKPWRRTLIVKLLGRSIAYLSLCNRVKQLWIVGGHYLT